MKIILIKADMAIVWLNINVAAICLIIVKLLNHSSELPESHKLKILLFLISSFLIISSDLLTSTEFSSGFEDWEELIILEISSSNSWEEAALLVIVLTTLSKAIPFSCSWIVNKVFSFESSLLFNLLNIDPISEPSFLTSGLRQVRSFILAKIN